MRELSAADLEDFAVGSWVLGCGGGGDTYHALLEARQLWAEGRRVALLDPDELGDDDLIACVGQMGAPTAFQERLTDGAVMAEAVRMMERHLGRRFRAIVLWEIGGNNGFQPILAGAHLGLPVVDADAMGRAFPQADMTTFAIHDLSAAPWTMVDIRHNRILFEAAEDWRWIERMTRPVCAVLGSTAATCKAPRTGAEIKRCTVPRTVSQALRIGAAIRDAQAAHADPVAALLGVEPGRVLFRGKLGDVERRTTEGWLVGRLEIEGLGADRGRRCAIEFRNEFLIAQVDGAPRAMVPDLICLLDSEAGVAVGTETVRYGQRVTVVVLPAPAMLTTPKGLAHVGPRAFGYDLDFVSAFA